VRYGCKLKNLPDSVHLFEIPNDRSVVLLPVFFEEKYGQKLVLGIISPRIFTRIKGKMRGLNQGERMFDKTDKPA
jgi:hypothetical protein